ncbi:MAG: magnesium/cobalt transporter CorA [Gemmatimonadaceae bacterium]|nr:magnesium/cobalt transporter CorA [Gemmatimonadaceae bacterium]MCW5826133.1 magnesium/cobalt transporter CorA [Gemmatimonadaceae bacterium]
MPRKRRASFRLHKHEQAPSPTGTPRSWYRDAHGAVRRDLDAAALTHAVASGEGLMWVDLHADSVEHRALLGSVFKFHPLSIEDTTSTEGRVKVEEFPAYTLVVVRGVRFLLETEDQYDIETFNLWTFVGRSYVVTVHGTHAPGVDATVERVGRDSALLERGAGRLMHHILDATVDAYFPIIDQLDEFVDGLEERVFVHFDQAALRDIFSVKRLVLTLRRHVAPMREVFNTLQSRPSAHISPEAQVYFRDVYDHVIRLNETLDTYRDLLTSTLDSYLTQISNRMGLVTKGLTVVATLSVPFVVVSGMWGMNFAQIPLSDWPHGFWVMLALQLGLGGGLLWMLRRNGWL